MVISSLKRKVCTNQLIVAKPIGSNSKQSSSHETNQDITCQNCGKYEYVAIRYWPRFSHSIQPNNLPQVFSTLNLEYDVNTKEWTFDTGACAHMTSYVGNLENLWPYNDSDHVLVGNGYFLRITYMDDATIGLGSSWIILYKILLVSELESNLLSIG